MDIGVIRRDGRSDPFFDGASRDVLMIRRCAACGRWYPPDASSCSAGCSSDLGWAAASGAASLVSWARVHPRAALTGRVGDAQTNTASVLIALIELAEGPWLYGRVECAEPREGLPLGARFVHPDEGESYPIFVEPS